MEDIIQYNYRRLTVLALPTTLDASIPGAPNGILALGISLCNYSGFSLHLYSSSSAICSVSSSRQSNEVVGSRTCRPSISPKQAHCRMSQRIIGWNGCYLHGRIQQATHCSGLSKIAEELVRLLASRGMMSPAASGDLSVSHDPFTLLVEPPILPLSILRASSRTG